MSATICGACGEGFPTPDHRCSADRRYDLHDLIAERDALQAEVVRITAENKWERGDLWNAYKELLSQAAVMRETLEWLRVGIAGMFGHPGKTWYEDLLDLAPERIEKALKQSPTPTVLRKCGLCYPGKPCNFENCPDEHELGEKK